MKRGSANLAGPLGDIVRHREDLLRLLVQQEVVITEVSTAHMPMKILGFHVEGKHVGKQVPYFPERSRRPRRGRDQLVFSKRRPPSRRASLVRGQHDSWQTSECSFAIDWALHAWSVRVPERQKESPTIGCDYFKIASKGFMLPDGNACPGIVHPCPPPESSRLCYLFPKQVANQPRNVQHWRARRNSIATPVRRCDTEVVVHPVKPQRGQAMRVLGVRFTVHRFAAVAFVIASASGKARAEQRRGNRGQRNPDDHRLQDAGRRSHRRAWLRGRHIAQADQGGQSGRARRAGTTRRRLQRALGTS